MEPQVVPVNGAVILVSGEGELSHVTRIALEFKSGDQWLPFPASDGEIFEGMVERGIGRRVRKTVVVFTEELED